jgi:hypothetical protein
VAFGKPPGPGQSEEPSWAVPRIGPPLDEDINPDQTSIYTELGIEPPVVEVALPTPAPKLRLITQTGEQLVLARGSQSLVRDPDGLYSRVVHPHSRRKSSIVGKYAAMVGTGMKFHWPDKLWWVEFFAGPGQLFEDETGEFLPGSPPAALSIKDRFRGYVFVDLDPLCVESLQRRVAGNGNVFVMQGDANAPETLDRITSIVPPDALVVMYADPEGLQFHLDTVRHFTARYRHMDWLINFPGPGIARYLSAGYEQRAIRVLDDPNPGRFIAEAPRGPTGRPCARSTSGSWRPWDSGHAQSPFT